MKHYIGDGTYVELQDEQYVLTTSNGLRDTNTIYLEPEVLAELIRYVSQCRKSSSTLSASYE